MSNFYRFPAMEKLEGFSDELQLQHIQEEATEAIMQFAYWYFASTPKVIEEVQKAERFGYGMELMDVIHATETALRMVFTDKEVEQLQQAVIEKNRKRGYYGEDN